MLPEPNHAAFSTNHAAITVPFATMSASMIRTRDTPGCTRSSGPLLRPCRAGRGSRYRLLPRSSQHGPHYARAVALEALVFVLGLPIALIAYVGGVTRGHPKHRWALSAAAAASIIWVTLLVLVSLRSS